MHTAVAVETGIVDHMTLASSTCTAELQTVMQSQRGVVTAMPVQDHTKKLKVLEPG